jgi:predicted  nucleic acid-binding Zn-ribbon protein
MPRPTLSDEVLERLEAVAADRLEKVPVDHLSTTQRLELLLDELEEADTRVEHLESHIDDLSDRLEAERAKNSTDDRGGSTQAGGGMNTNFRRGP